MYHIEYFFDGKFVDKRTLNSLFESEGFDTDVDTVEDEIKKAVRSVKLGNLDGNAIHIAHNSIGNRIDVVFSVSNIIGNVKSLSDGECIIRINGNIYEQGEDMWNFGFAIYLVCDVHHFDFALAESKKKSAKRSLKESTDESFSLYDLNKHDHFIKEWVKNINKELKDVSIESIGDDEIVFRVWFDETMNLDIFDDIVTDCMPKTLIEFISNMNIDFDYQFVYADDKFIENNYVFIRFVAW